MDLCYLECRNNQEIMFKTKLNNRKAKTLKVTGVRTILSLCNRCKLYQMVSYKAANSFMLFTCIWNSLLCRTMTSRFCDIIHMYNQLALLPGWNNQLLSYVAFVMWRFGRACWILNGDRVSRKCWKILLVSKIHFRNRKSRSPEQKYWNHWF